jgi:hypothetical protein
MYQRRWYPAMMGDFCWVLQKEDESPHKRKKINLFCAGLYWYLIVLSVVFKFFYCFDKNNIDANGLSHVVHNSESRRARIDLLTFIVSADPNYPRLGVFTAVIKRNFKNVM